MAFSRMLFFVSSIFFPFSCAMTAGSSGYALRWDRRRPADVVSWEWDSVPQTEGVSYEMWVKILDPFIDFQTPFSFGVYDASNISVYSVPYEVSLYVSPGYVSMWKVNQQADCANASVLFNQWTHLAWTQDYSNGELKIYQNGNLKCTFANFDAQPPHNHGLVSMGMEGTSLEASAYSDHSLFDGVMDEFRIWDGVRSELEIQSHFMTTLNVSAPENAKINTYLNFDLPGPTMLDETRKIVAEVGRLATYRQYVVQVEKPSGLPSAPDAVYSDCPVVGGLTVILVDQSEAVFQLPYHGNITGVSAVIQFTSMNGTLRQANGTVISGPTSTVSGSNFTLKYTAGNNSSGNYGRLQVLDQLTYTFSGGELTTSLSGQLEFTWGVEPAVVAEALTTNENNLNFVMVGINTIRGTRLPVEIVNVSRGTIYELTFDSALLNTSIQFFANYQTADVNVSNLAVISSFPYSVNNGPGVVLYLPPDNYVGTMNAFDYHAVGDSTILGFHVNVVHVNQAPLLLGIKIDNSSNSGNTTATTDKLVVSTPVNFTFTSSDVDTTYAPQTFYRILDFPKFGTLVDVSGSNDGNNSTASLAQEDQSQMYGWAEDVVAVSTVFPVCTGEDASNFRECADHSYGPLEALGPYDYFPKYGDSVKGYSPQFFGNVNWAIFKIKPVVLNLMEVYETVNPGAILQVRASDHFYSVNESLTWPLLWASPIPAPIFPSEPYVFTPALCPSFFIAEYIRFDITADRVGIQYNMDAIGVGGTMAVDKGWLRGDTVTYQPARGIHINSTTIALDTLSYQASDCEDVSDPSSISILSPVYPKTHINDTNSFFYNVPVFLSIGVVIFEMLSFDNLIQIAYNDLVARDVDITGDAVIELISVSQPLSLLSSQTSVSLTLPVVLPVNHTSVMVKLIETGGYVNPVELSAWVYHDLYVHRMQLVLTPSCMNIAGFYQDSDPGSPCRLCSSVTLDEYSSSSFSSLQRLTYDSRCPRLMDERVRRNAANGLAFITTLSLFVAVAAVAWAVWHRASRIVFFAGLEFLIAIATGFSMAVLGSQLALYDQCYYPWLVHPGLALAFSCGLARNYRLNEIFNSKLLRTRLIKGWQLGIFVFSVFVVDIIILSVSTGIRPVERGDFGECLLMPEEEPILVSVEFALALLSLYYAYRSRNVPSRFNESKWLSFVLVNALVLGTLAVCLEITLYLQYGEALTFRFIVYAWVSFTGLCCTFLPKIIAHRKNPLQRPGDSDPKFTQNNETLVKIKQEFSRSKSAEFNSSMELTSESTLSSEVPQSAVDDLKKQLKKHIENVQKILTARAALDDKAKELEQAQMEAESARFIVETEIEFLMKQRLS